MKEGEYRARFCNVCSESVKDRLRAQVSYWSFNKFLGSFLMLLLLFSGAPVHADITGYVTVSTNYLWRGVTQTDDNPAISAVIEYHMEQGNYLGIWSSNINYGDRRSLEVNAYLGHEFDLAKATINLAVRSYYFPSGGKYSFDFQPDKWEDKESSFFPELQASVTFKGVNAGYSYSNNYLDSGKQGHYIDLNYTHLIMDDLSLKIHYGSQKSEAIDDTQDIVSDSSVTLMWRKFFVTASNMEDNEDGRQSDMVRYVFGLIMDIGH